MTLIFALFTTTLLFAAALFAQITGLAATSYFGLAIALGLYVISRNRKEAKLATVTSGQ